MSITLIRVVNQQTIRRSILLDKLDDGQANTPGYANRPKQKVYVPYSNLVDPSVKGYVDLVPSDRVLLSADRGTIKGLTKKSPPYISTFAFASALIATPTIASAVHSGITHDTTINGTTYFSVTPDVTYVTFQNMTNGSQVVPFSAFSAFSDTQIKVADGTVTIGVPGTGWVVTVQANSKTVSFTLP